MKKSFFLFPLALILFACHSETKPEAQKNTTVLWSADIQTILPVENDTVDGDDLDRINMDAKYNRDSIFKSLTGAVLSGKLKAFKNYPNEPLTADEVKHKLVTWDSTAVAEDPNNPGTFVSAPLKMEVGAWSVPCYRFHESIELDTAAYTMKNKVSYITLYLYKFNEKGEHLGIMKFIDIKLND